ncbi:syntaxin-like protein [Amanita muscaria]
MSSRDRLAALRAQRQEQQRQPAHELDTFNAPQRNSHANGYMPSFFEEVTALQADIEQLNGNVTLIAMLHLRLGNALPDAMNPDAQQLDLMREETRTLINELRDRVKKLENVPAGPDASIRRNQVPLVRSKFLEAIQNYQRVENDYRLQARSRVERQLRIVKPDATDAELRAAVEGGADQIFSQALVDSTRYKESRVAYQEVQQRQEDLRKMEETLAELAQMLGDMALLVTQQDEAIGEVEKTASEVEKNTKKGFQHTVQAVIHARSYRKMRWICFFIVLIILAILALVLGLVFGTRK